jgi:hypothetical protein
LTWFYNCNMSPKLYIVLLWSYRLVFVVVIFRCRVERNWFAKNSPIRNCESQAVHIVIGMHLLIYSTTVKRYFKALNLCFFTFFPMAIHPVFAVIWQILHYVQNI